MKMLYLQSDNDPIPQFGRSKSTSARVNGYHFEIKEEASDEISDAFTWYEDQKEGLGSEFVSLLEEYFERITEEPLLYPQDNEQRVAVMDRFPYKVVFGIEKKSIVVYSGFNTSRDPKKLKR